MTITTDICIIGAGPVGLFAVFEPGRALCKQSKPRIGILSGLPADKSVLGPMLLGALAQLGYAQDAVEIQYRHSDETRVATRIARELIAARCDLIFALGGATQVSGFREARTSVPVVFVGISFDPVELRIVDSLARPGGNITGVYVPTDALAAKRVELARELLPNARRFLLLADSVTRSQIPAIRKAVDSYGGELTIVQYERSPYDLVRGFERGRAAGVQAVFLPVSAAFARQRAQFSSLLVQYKLPAFVPEFLAGEEGSLASYSVDVASVVRRAAELGVRILKGVKATDIPVEQPSEYVLVINLKTAKTLGIEIPPSVLTRATRVVE